MAKHDWHAIMNERYHCNDNNDNNEEPTDYSWVGWIGVGILSCLVLEAIGVWATLLHVPEWMTLP